LADRPRRAFRPATESEPDLAEGLEMTLSHIVEALRRIGIDQIVAVDLAPGNVDFQVVRLLVPGLEGLVFEAGYVPGARSHDRIAAAGSRA
jgi:ribosomal protein S12 methylthiotransferase accessory factor YcaO